MRKGFSIVELSIILVIIGLLIGGFLAAKSLMDASRITVTIAQIEQFDQSIIAFKTKHKYLPGDAPLYGGDGDRYVDATAGSGEDNTIDKFTCEIANFWWSLDSSKYASSTCNATGTSAQVEGTSRNVPETKMGDDGTFLIVSPLTDVSGKNINSNFDARGHYYAFMDPSQVKTHVGTGTVFRFAETTAANRPLINSDAYAFDKKTDDGLPIDGDVRIVGFFANADGGAALSISAAVNSACGTAFKYTADDTRNCTLAIRVGAKGGQSQ